MSYPWCITQHSLQQPGRFYAIAVIKALLAHIIVTYGAKFEEGKNAPRQRRIGPIRIPENADVLFRKRQK